MKKFIISIFCLLSLNVFASDASSLSSYLQNLQTIETNFSQITSDASGNIKQKMTGELKMKRPNLFKWTTDDNLKQELVSNGITVWFYDVDLEQVTVQALDSRLTNTPMALLSGDVLDIEKKFNVSLQATGEVENFTLSPKAANAMFETLRISFKDGYLSEMQLTDNTGQRTNIVFYDLYANLPLDSTIFNFDIPDNVDVIYK